MTTEAMERRTDPLPEDPHESKARQHAEIYFAELAEDQEPGAYFRCRITGAYCPLEEVPCDTDCRNCNFALAYMLTGKKPSRVGL